MRCHFALIAAALLAGTLSAAAQARKNPGKLTVRLTVLQTTVNLTEDAEPTPAKLTTTWYTPTGSRKELADGKYHILTESPKTSILVSPEEEKAVRMVSRIPRALAKAETERLMKPFRQMENDSRPTEYRRELFLGRPCRVVTGWTKIGPYASKSTIWYAQVGGHEVKLKENYSTYQSGRLAEVRTEEVIRIEAVPTPPKGLLAIPAGYEVEERVIGAELLRALSSGLKELQQKK
jgi:hypothetical protein